MIIVDNVIQDSKVLKKFSDAQLWTDCDNDTTLDGPRKVVQTNTETGTKLKDAWEFISFYLYDIPSLDLPSYGATEIEYWANVLSPRAELEWHQDKREDLMIESGTLVHPLVGVIWYGYPHEVLGGYLEIKNHSDRQEEVERIQPVYNRAVVFDPTQWHRVAPIVEGERFGFQLNLW